MKRAGRGIMISEISIENTENLFLPLPERPRSHFQVHLFSSFRLDQKMHERRAPRIPEEDSLRKLYNRS